MPLPEGNELDINLELAEFLMNDLASTYSDFENDSTFAFAVMTNIAIVGSSIPESLLRLYTAPVAELIGSEMTESSMRYFHGASILSIDCDCAGQSDGCLVDSVEENVWYLKGKQDLIDGSPVYNRAVSDVISLRTELF